MALIRADDAMSGSLSQAMSETSARLAGEAGGGAFYAVPTRELGSREAGRVFAEGWMCAVDNLPDVRRPLSGT